jgi:hypothetical protein
MYNHALMIVFLVLVIRITSHPNGVTLAIAEDLDEWSAGSPPLR